MSFVLQQQTTMHVLLLTGSDIPCLLGSNFLKEGATTFDLDTYCLIINAYSLNKWKSSCVYITSASHALHCVAKNKSASLESPFTWWGGKWGELEGWQCNYSKGEQLSCGFTCLCIQSHRQPLVEPNGSCFTSLYH